MGSDAYNVRQAIILNRMETVKFVTLKDVKFALQPVQVVYLVRICIIKMDQHVLFVNL